MVSKRMLSLTPFILWTALSGAIYVGVFVPVMINAMKGNPESEIWLETTQRKYCLLSLIGNGIGQIVGAFLLGYIQDHFSNRITSLVCLALSSFAITITIIFVLVNNFSLTFAFTICLLWGL